MLAPFISHLLIASLVLLLAGWASNAFGASTHDDPSGLDSEWPRGWNQMSGPRKPRRVDDPNATWTVRALPW